MQPQSRGGGELLLDEKTPGSRGVPGGPCIHQRDNSPPSTTFVNGGEVGEASENDTPSRGPFLLAQQATAPWRNCERQWGTDPPVRSFFGWRFPAKKNGRTFRMRAKWKV